MKSFIFFYSMYDTYIFQWKVTEWWYRFHGIINKKDKGHINFFLFLHPLKILKFYTFYILIVSPSMYWVLSYGTNERLTNLHIINLFRLTSHMRRGTCFFSKEMKCEDNTIFTMWENKEQIHGAWLWLVKLLQHKIRSHNFVTLKGRSLY